ncbi:MAG: hypothetical protein MUF47_10895 [Porphyrobacter sp.]|nr:hypothetical protein [Porphyrobacter sp.]
MTVIAARADLARHLAALAALAATGAVEVPQGYAEAFARQRRTRPDGLPCRPRMRVRDLCQSASA